MFHADGKGNWSIDGCTTLVDPNDFSQATCHCDHLTNFALLVVSKLFEHNIDSNLNLF